MSRVLGAVVGAVLAVVGCKGSDGKSRPSGAAEPHGAALRSMTPTRRVVVRRRTPAPKPPKLRPPVIRTLPVAGYSPSSYVAPTVRESGPRPVLVLLHGSYDARTSECRAWGRVGARHGWLLCPAGRHRPDQPKTSDRWTWGKVAHLVKELRRGLDALEKRYPGRVDRRRLTLVGFSLGALLAHEVAYFTWGMFPRLVIVEGVARLRGKWSRRLYRRGVRRVAYVCGEKTHCTVQVPKRKMYLERVGITVGSFVIPGVGHEYGDNFDPLAERILAWVLAEKRPSKYRLPRRRRHKR